MILGIDTSTSAITVALGSLDGAGRVEVRDHRSVVDPRAHTERLAPLIADALTAVGAGPRDLAGIVVGTGPGPFTGLRVGLVTAATMGHALGIPVYGVCSLDALAASIPPSDIPAELLVATDARRKEVYWAKYTRREPPIPTQTPTSSAGLPTTGLPGAGLPGGLQDAPGIDREFGNPPSMGVAGPGGLHDAPGIDRDFGNPPSKGASTGVDAGPSMGVSASPSMSASVSGPDGDAETVRVGEGLLERVDGPAVERPGELPSELRALPTLGRGPLLFPALFPNPLPLPVDVDAAWLLTVAGPRIAAGQPMPITPRYLRRPDALTTAERATR